MLSEPSPYVPAPIDTGSVALDPGMVPLLEKLAENAHEVWAKGRVDDGWSWGPKREDDARHHPCLISYSLLPDAEKAYDRRVVGETLKAIISLGWRLLPPAAANAVESSTTDWDELSDRFGLMELSRLLEHWRARALWPDAWSKRPRLYHRLAKRLLGLGHLVLAEVVAQEGLERAASDELWSAWLRHVLGLAAARYGSPQLALDRIRVISNDNLVRLDAIGTSTLGGPSLFVEMRSLEARVHKDLGLAANGAERQRLLELARDLYLEAARPPALAGAMTTDSFPLVNAAAISLWLGDAAAASEFAALANELALTELASQPKNMWAAATIGECALITGDVKRAMRYYRQAVTLSGKELSHLATIRRQAYLHARYLGVPLLKIDRCIAIPPVVVFCGHIADSDNRERPRFPADSERNVADAIAAQLDGMGAAFGFSGAAAGSDLLFLEAMQRRRKPVHVVLPFRRERFEETSVAPAAGTWIDRFRRLVARLDQHQLLDELAGTPTSAGGLAFEYGNLLTLGLARLKARELSTELVGLAVWDGEDGLEGGTAATVRNWDRLEGSSPLGHSTWPPFRVEVIPLPSSSTVVRPAAQRRRDAPSNPIPSETRYRIAGVLFADVKNFSGISEEHVLRFFDVFLGTVGRLLANAPFPPLVRNTWGDGLFLVFPRVEQAGTFALDLSAVTAAIRWEQEGLPKDLAVRVGVHAGPLFEFVDRVTGQLTLSGRHVTQAARIEPITPPGLVYASREFAALSAAYNVREYVSEPVGVVPLAKSFGQQTLYVLRRTSRGVETPPSPTT